VDITQLLAFSVKNKASDLHLCRPAADDPRARRRAPHQRRRAGPQEVHAMVYDIMNDAQRKSTKSFWSRLLVRDRGPGALPVNAFNQNRGAARCSGPFRPRS
jgi:twitching motility protein PilT